MVDIREEREMKKYTFIKQLYIKFCGLLEHYSNSSYNLAKFYKIIDQK